MFSEPRELGGALISPSSRLPLSLGFRESFNKYIGINRTEDAAAALSPPCSCLGIHLPPVQAGFEPRMNT